MKVLELCLSPALGGLELYMFRTSQELSKSGKVMAILNPKGKLRSVFEKNNLAFEMEFSLFRLFPVLTAWRISQKIDQNEIDVIHVHWGKDLSLAALSKLFSKRKPRLIYTRQMKMTRKKQDFYHQFLYRQMDCMLAITDRLAREAAGFLADEHTHKIKRLYYGVDEPPRWLAAKERQELRASLGFNDQDFLVGLFGRIEVEKGQHLLVESLEMAKSDGVSLSLLIVGHAMDEGYLSQLKQRIKRQNMEKQAVFRGFVDQPQDWMQICDCVVLATKEETFGLVLVEAMRAGVAVLGTRAGGVPEIIDEGRTGLMFQPGCAKELYNGLVRFQNDPHFRGALASAGQKKAETLFSSENHFQALRSHMKS